MMEGTGKYFLLIFIIFLIVYITVKVCLGFLLVRMKDKMWKAYIPFYTTSVIVKILGMKSKVFYMTLIPFLRYKYFNQIIKKLLEGFGLDPKESIMYVLLPMYKFPELVFKKPHFILNEYDLTEGFLDSQNVLFTRDKEENKEEVKNENVNTENNFNQNIVSPEQSNFNQNIVNPEELNNQNKPNSVNPEENTVWANEKPKEQTVIKDNHSSFIQNINNVNDNIIQKENEIEHETFVEAKKEEVKEKPAITPLNQGEVQVCPNCGAKLAPGTTVCFMCGHKL